MFSEHESRFDAVTGRRRSANAPGGTGRGAKPRLRTIHRACGVLLVLAPLAFTVSGCNGWFRPVSWSELGSQSKPQPKPKSPFAVVPRNGREVANLSADDMVRVMQRVGFADEQILELGTELHAALAVSGAAEITYHNEPLARFQIEGDYLQIRSRSGAFQYQISTGQFVSPSPQGGY